MKFALNVAAALLISVSGAFSQQQSIEPPVDPAKLREEFLKWKFGLFLHFHIATFNNREWANGYEDPLTFAPDNLDCGQWADAAKDAGVKYAVFTVKHTEAYPLWDSKVTDHDITAFKNYKDGKGDIVREFVDAFRQRGIKIGLYYCAPNDYDNKFGNTLPPGKPSLKGMPPEAAGDFPGFMKKQFTELLTDYGPIDLIWCDQYKYKLSAKQWRDIKAHIKKLQPNCLVVANNSHDLRETDIHSYEYPLFKNDSGYPTADNTTPAEVCDTITDTGSWFWKPNEEGNIRSAEELAKVIRMCNDRRANYLLNVGPDKSGRIPEAYVKRLKEVGSLLEGSSKNLSGSLFYKAQHPETGNMWDVWLYHHEGIYYLYYLANAGPRPPKGQPWNNISLATSPDGVHWTEKGPILKKADEATWMGTGSTWKSPAFDQDGKFYMNFSEEIGGRQTIHFAESKDLLHWTRLEGEEYRFVPDERWYQRNGRWDCIWTLPKPGGGFYGYWTASPHSKSSKFGFGESGDGLHWRALPPPEVLGVNRKHAEVGAVEKIGDKYYMLLGNYPPDMVTLVAERPEGPFRAAEKNFNILTGHTYFCRFFPHPTDGMLVCHFIQDRNGNVSFAPLKDARIDGEGTLRLGWWKGNEKMKRVAIAVETPSETVDAMAMFGPVFDPRKGIILEGTLRLPKGREEPRSGLYIECGKSGGAAVLIDHNGVAELGSLQANGEGFEISERQKRDLKRVDREMTFANPARFRLLLKGALMEFYLDDILIESFALPDNATGRIGLINSAETLGTLKAWE